MKPAPGLFSDPYSRLLNKKELSIYLHLSPASIDRLRREGVIPFYRVGGAIRFRLSEVERAIERHHTRVHEYYPD